jgi:hypothetical protein
MKDHASKDDQHERAEAHRSKRRISPTHSQTKHGWKRYSGRQRVMTAQHDA